ncbi:MAG: hypothetical protein EU539_11725 [Promethearchaeota archaeon]|nr:MAG: hypothetical protein EU539_11725 [Candidatus Lokiarchaeota archaeon]
MKMRRIKIHNKIKNVLFVCMGNTARSPAAEYLAKHLKKKYQNELDDITFDSAGFFNAFSYMQPESREYLKSKGINESDFRPKIINKNLLEKQDLILTMEKAHSHDIVINYSEIPDIEKRVYTLKEFSGEVENPDIIDPYYTSTNIYKKILKIIDTHVEKAIMKIIKINNQMD